MKYNKIFKCQLFFCLHNIVYLSDFLIRVKNVKTTFIINWFLKAEGILVKLIWK